MKPYKKALGNLLAGITILCLIGALFLFVKNHIENTQGQEVISDFQQSFVENTATPLPTAATVPSIETTSPLKTTEPTPPTTSTPEPAVENPYKEAYQSNSDMVG